MAETPHAPPAPRRRGARPMSDWMDRALRTHDSCNELDDDPRLLETGASPPTLSPEFLAQQRVLAAASTTAGEPYLAPLIAGALDAEAVQDAVKAGVLDDAASELPGPAEEGEVDDNNYRDA